MIYYLLFQIKRFFCNLCSDVSKIKIKLPKKKTRIVSIKKEERIVVEFDEKLLEKDISPIFIKSPLFQLVKEYKTEIFDNILESLKDYDFKVKIGIEVEFYTENPPVESVKEKGKNQYEIQTKTYTNLNLLVEDYLKIRQIDADFRALPCPNDCGSALQINISLEKDGKNLFARNEKGEESPLMLNCVAGLLKNINRNLLLYIKDDSCLKRFDLEQNKKVRDMGGYPAPTFISWGINNRSCAIRIPTPKNLKNYKEEDAENRRIEFRVPSAEADIHLVLIGVLSSIIEGIDYGLLPHIAKTAFDVIDKNEGLEKIENDIEKLNNNFNLPYCYQSTTI